MTMRKAFAAILLILGVSGCQATKPPPVPSAWRELRIFGTHTQDAWERYWSDNRVDVQAIVEDQYRLGSHHDGDRQFETAMILFCTEEDPYEVLASMIESPDPYRRSFAALVAGYLADKRFYTKLKAMLSDEAELKDHDDDTVGKRARTALERMLDDGDLNSPELAEHVASWLRKARAAEVPGD